MQILLLLLLQFFLGSIYNLTPAVSTLITDSSFQGFSLTQYGLLYVCSGVFGACASFLFGPLSEKKGAYFPFSLGVLFFSIAFILMGTVLISPFAMALNFTLFLLVHLFLGGAYGFIFPITFLLIGGLHPKKIALSYTAYSIPVVLGATFISYFFHLGYIAFIILGMICCYLLIYIFFDLFVDFPEKTKESIPLKFKDSWHYYLPMWSYGIIDSFIIVLSFLYFSKIFNESTIHTFFISFLIFSRILFSFLLMIFSFNKIYFVTGLVLMILPMIQHSVNLDPTTFFIIIMFLVSPFFPFAFINPAIQFPLNRAKILGNLFGIYILTVGLTTWMFNLLNEEAYVLVLSFASVLQFITIAISLYFNRKNQNVT